MHVHMWYYSHVAVTDCAVRGIFRCRYEGPAPDMREACIRLAPGMRQAYIRHMGGRVVFLDFFGRGMPSLDGNYNHVYPTGSFLHWPRFKLVPLSSCPGGECQGMHRCAPECMEGRALMHSSLLHSEGLCNSACMPFDWYNTYTRAHTHARTCAKTYLLAIVLASMAANTTIDQRSLALCHTPYATRGGNGGGTSMLATYARSASHVGLTALPSKCQDKSTHCEGWKAIGECTGANKAHMETECRLTCGLCDDGNRVVTLPVSKAESGGNPSLALVVAARLIPSNLGPHSHLCALP